LATAVEVSPERFFEGLTMQQYIKGIEKNRDLFIQNYEDFGLKADDERFFRGVGPLKVLVLLEDWCGDAIRYVPALARVAEAARDWDVRVFYRDQNLDLSGMCLKDDKHRAIPALLFFDMDMNQLTCWIEKPSYVYQAEAEARARFAAENPNLPDAALSLDDMSDNTRATYITFIRQFRADNRKEWQQLFVDEVRERLEVAGLGIKHLSG
jgi:Thioredoxin